MKHWREVTDQFTPYSGPVEQDSYRDFLGARTRMRYMPAPYQALAGTAEGRSSEARAGLHDTHEWAGVLSAVLDARNKYVCVELGAGYGPFVVGSALKAKEKGISDITLIAVEGSEHHLDFMKEHFTDNGLAPAEHHLHAAVVGTYDGVARFPKLRDPTTEWGAEAQFSESEGTALRTPQLNDDFEEVPCLTLATILRPVAIADVVHFDIQGSEFDVITQGLDTLMTKARRIVIGTHGRDIEMFLIKLLESNGWELEIEKACTYQPSAIGLTLAQDGVQVWRNTAFSIDQAGNSVFTPVPKKNSIVEAVDPVAHERNVLRDSNRNLQRHIEALEMRNETLEDELTKITGSTVWKATAPLRSVTHKVLGR